MTTLTPEPEPVTPVLRTPSFSSLSQLLEVLGSTPDLQSVLGVVDEFEDEFDRERESDLFNDTLAAALASSYTTPTDSHTPTVELARDKELPLPPSTLPLSLPLKSTPMSKQDNHHQDPPSSSTPVLTKRRHALLELLTSERAYASDLTLIRDVYMRLASGYPPSFNFSNARPVSGSRISNTGSNTSSSSSGSANSHSGTCSSSSSRTVSTASTSDISTSALCTSPIIQLNVPSVHSTIDDSSNAHTPSTLTQLSRSPASEPPLSVTDVHIIFRNISDLAVLSDILVSKLEKVIEEEDGNGVGEVFLEVVPRLAAPYTTYITAHPRALAHLDALSSSPQLTPQFSHWLKESKALVESHTHAWDLPSLLIKPVQRLLKYGLLLGALINATPEPVVVVTPESESVGIAFGKLKEGSEGLEKLRQAKQRVEEVAHAVNERKRRVEIVREVLGSGHAKDGAGTANIGIPKVGAVSRMRSLRTPKPPSSSVKSPSKRKGSISTPEPDTDPEHAESALLAALEGKLQSHITTLSLLVRDSLAYAKSLRMLFKALVKWAWAFAGVIGVTVSPELSPPDNLLPPTPNPADITATGQSEAFDAFMIVCAGLVELAQELEHELHTHVIPSLQSLKATSSAPLKLLGAVHTLHPLHLHLLHLPITRKQRPPEALLQASQSYVALRGQLALELPVYVRLLERGVDGVVLDLGKVLEAFWGVVRERWSELWDALKVEGEGLGRAESTGIPKNCVDQEDVKGVSGPRSGGETVRVWRERWSGVLDVLGTLAVVNPPRKIERLRPINYPTTAHGQYRPTPQQVAKAANGMASLDSLASPSRTRLPRHQHHASYDARYETRPREYKRDEAKYGREREYDVRHSQGSQNSYDFRSSQNSYDTRGSPNFYDTRSSQSSASSYSPASRTSGDVPGRRRSGSTNNIPTGPIVRKPSNESLRSGTSSKSGTSYRNSPGAGRGTEDIPPVPSPLPPRSQSCNRVSPPPLKPARMKSMPGPMLGSGLDVPPSPSSLITFDEEEEEQDKDRGRQPSLKSKIADSFRPSHHRRRSSSVKSLGAPSTQSPSYHGTDAGFPAYAYQTLPTPTRTSSPQTPTRRNTDLHGLRALYQCAAIHVCIPPAGVSYRGLPFFELRPGDTFDVLREYGHPSTHPDLPLYVDDGEDCLLLVREVTDLEGGRGRDMKGKGEVGWALASFLVPLD